MVLLAAFGALMHRYTHADDFLVAAPVLNRGAGARGRASATTATPWRMRLRPQPRQTFRELVAHDARHRGRCFRASADQPRPGGPRAQPRPPSRRRADDQGDLRVRAEPTAVASIHPASPASVPSCAAISPSCHWVSWSSSTLRKPRCVVEAEYLVEVSTRPLANQLLAHYAVLLDDALPNPDRPIGAARRDGPCGRGLAARYRPARNSAPPATTLAALVEAQVARTPDGVAMVYEGRNYTYREINESANRFAHWLIDQGIGAEDRVAVLLDKSPELVITALGVIKAGAVYLPVDPTYPEDRLNFILADSEPKLVLREAVGDLDATAARPHRRRPGPPAAPGEHRVPDLHLGVHRAAQGRAGSAPAGRGVLRLVQGRLPGRPTPTACCRSPRRASTCRSARSSACWPAVRGW